MKNRDRIVARPHTEKIPAHWLFKTSEGVMGPFDSRELAEQTLAGYVSKCMEAGKVEVISNA